MITTKKDIPYELMEKDKEELKGMLRKCTRFDIPRLIGQLSRSEDPKHHAMVELLFNHKPDGWLDVSSKNCIIKKI